jgi:hypothetical protein
MLTQLMTQLVARLTSTTPASVTALIASSSRADGYNIYSLLITIVKSVDTIMNVLVAKPRLTLL